MINWYWAVIASLFGSALGFWLGRQFRQPVADGRFDQSLGTHRQEMGLHLKNLSDSLNQQLVSQQALLNQSIKDLRQDNHQQLDRMRQTVDEKLQSALEKRLTESFKRVDRQLAEVNDSMGQMQALASDVGQLQKTLAGVKTKGVWGEAHLENLLSDILNPEQYQKEFRPYPRRADKVEFALKIPGDQADEAVYMPIDAKLPLIDFEKLQEALVDGQLDVIKKARQALYRNLKSQAKKISTKYLNPPITTNFAVMYLPMESLYAEISQNAELIEELRQTYNVTVAGPSTILPMLGLLNMGYRSLAMRKQAGQIWSALIETQAEVFKFASLLERARLKLDEAGDVIDDASSKTRSLEKKFKRAQSLDIDKELIDKELSHETV